MEQKNGSNGRFDVPACLFEDDLSLNASVEPTGSFLMKNG